MYFDLSNLYSEERQRDLLNCRMPFVIYACLSRLYKTICIADTDKLTFCLTIQDENFGNCCKVLKLARKSDWEKDKDSELEILLYYLPKVKILNLEHGWQCSDQLIQLATHSKLIKHVHTIIPYGFDWLGTEAQFYYDCVDAFINTLRNMDLISIGSNLSATKCKSENIISFLPDSTALTRLSITNRDDKDFSLIPELSMFALMFSCSNFT